MDLRDELNLKLHEIFIAQVSDCLKEDVFEAVHFSEALAFVVSHFMVSEHDFLEAVGLSPEDVSISTWAGRHRVTPVGVARAYMEVLLEIVQNNYEQKKAVCTEMNTHRACEGLFDTTIPKQEEA